MKVLTKEYENIEKVKIEVYRCPYCWKVLNNKKSYRKHLLENSYCKIVRDYGYDHVSN